MIDDPLQTPGNRMAGRSNRPGRVRHGPYRSRHPHLLDRITVDYLAPTRRSTRWRTSGFRGPAAHRHPYDKGPRPDREGDPGIRYRPHARRMTET